MIEREEKHIPGVSGRVPDCCDRRIGLRGRKREATRRGSEGGNSHQKNSREKNTDQSRPLPRGKEVKGGAGATGGEGRNEGDSKGFGVRKEGTSGGVGSGEGQVPIV